MTVESLGKTRALGPLFGRQCFAPGLPATSPEAHRRRVLLSFLCHRCHSMRSDTQCQALAALTARHRAPVIESLNMAKEPSQPEEPFQSWEAQTAFDSKIGTAAKWIREAACSMGYDRSAVSIIPVGAVALRLTVEHSALGREYEVEFNRRLIEGIADGDVSVMDQASRMIQSIVPWRA